MAMCDNPGCEHQLDTRVSCASCGVLEYCSVACRNAHFQATHWRECADAQATCRALMCTPSWLRFSGHVCPVVTMPPGHPRLWRTYGKDDVAAIVSRRQTLIEEYVAATGGTTASAEKHFGFTPTAKIDIEAVSFRPSYPEQMVPGHVLMYYTGLLGPLDVRTLRIVLALLCRQRGTLNARAFVIWAIKGVPLALGTLLLGDIDGGLEDTASIDNDNPTETWGSVVD